MIAGADLTASRKLQWGRDSSVAEMADDRGLEPLADHASMGPRLFSRGNHFLPRQADRGFEASMGPRLFSRGNSQQFDHFRQNDFGLQWGRDSSVAEMACVSIGARYSNVSFNGAATLQSRKSGGALAPLPPRATLSMGPRLFSRGNEAQRVCVGSRGRASMGPRLFSRGNRKRCSGSGTAASGFNGAATLQSRKSAIGG